MTAGFGFALARARAARATLVTLGAVTALAAMLVVGVLGAERTARTDLVREAVASASGERAEIVVRTQGDPDAARAAAQEVVSAHGWDGVLIVSAGSGRIVMRPDALRLTADDLDAVAAVAGDVRDEVERATGQNAQVSGELAGTLQKAGDAIALRAGPTAVALGILGLIAAVIVGAVALEPVRARGSETALLRARGARRGLIVRLAAAESLAVGLAGASAGAAVGVGATAAVGGVPATGLEAVTVVAATGLVAAGTAAAGTWRSADATGRARAAVDVGVAVLLTVVTGVAVWQFVRAGSPVVTRGDGARTIDPIVALAPALALALAALVAVMVATPLARAVATWLQRTRRTSPVTPLRLASRRPARHALSITTVAFAIGSLALAGAYQGTLAALGDSPDVVRVGADARVTTIPATVDPAALAAAEPQEASMLSRALPATGADGRITVLAVGADALGDVMTDAGGTVDPEAMGEAISIGDAGAAETIPAVVSAGLARSMGLTEGEGFSLELQTSPRFDADFVVAGLAAVLPGTPTGEGILVDLRAIALASPADVSPNQVWFASPDPAALAAAIGEAHPGTVVLVADPDAARSAAGTALPFGLAAAGAVALALVVLILRRTRSRADARELALLALLGLGRRRAARLRASEDLFAVVLGVIGGLAAGTFTAWLVVPALVRAAYGTIPDAYPVPLAVDPVTLGGALAAASVAFGIVVATVRAPVRLAPLLREDE